MQPTSASAPSDAPAPRSSATKVPTVASRRAPMVRLFVGLFRRAPDGDLRLSARNHLGKPAFPAAPSCLGVAAVFVSSSPSCRKLESGDPPLHGRGFFICAGERQQPLPQCGFSASSSSREPPPPRPLCKPLGPPAPLVAIPLEVVQRPTQLVVAGPDLAKELLKV